MEPVEFLDQASESVDKQVSIGMKEFKEELVKSISTKKMGEISEGRLDETCHQIHNRTRESFDKNMGKFRIYAMRNIFVPSSDASSSSAPKISIPETDPELIALREKYLSLQSDYRSLSDSCRDTEVLLKDMRGALFTLRVGAQAFDDIQPIAETVASITHNRNKLVEMCEQAQGIMEKIGEYSSGGEAMDTTPSEIGPVSIQTQNADDIMLLGRSLRK